MHVDPHTRRVLEIDRVLDHLARRAVSSLGAEAIRALSPTHSVREIEDRIAPLREAIRLLEGNRQLPLAGLFDAKEIFEEAMLEGAVLPHDRWPRVCTFLEVCHAVSKFGAELGEDFPALGTEARGIEPDAELYHAIKRLFEVRGGVLTETLRDDASPELDRVRRALRRAEQDLLRTIGKLVRELTDRGYLQESFSTMRNGRHVLPLKSSFRGRVAGIMHGSSSSGETLFVEPMELLEGSNAIEEWKAQEQAEEYRILRALTAQLKRFAPLGVANVERLARLDMVQAIAKHAYEHGWNVPTLQRGGPLRLLAAHHPLLHLEQKTKSVPLALMLRPGDRAIVFSGPNAGGKTTAMKTIGLNVWLFQSGLPIPASPDSTMPVYGGLIADIGDSQDLSAGLSTFSGHITRLADALRHATMAPSDRGAIVLLDELGTGTDPTEGCALAISLLEAFVKTAAMTVTTSHFDAVKTWAAETEGVRNASFSLDGDTRRPTFRVRLDLPGASEALEIARSVGLPRAVLERARELTGPDRIRMGDLLRSIEERERELARLVREGEERKEALERQETIARARVEQLKEERRIAREHLHDEKERTIRELRDRIEKMIAELPSEDDILRRRELLSNVRRDLVGESHRLSAEGKKLLRATERDAEVEFRVGKKVFVRTLGDWAEIIDAPPGGKKVRLLMGHLEVEVLREDLLAEDPAKRRRELAQLMQEATAAAKPGARSKPKTSRKLKSALDELDRADETRPAGPPAKKAMGGAVARLSAPLPGMTFDMHGMRVEEGLAALDKYLDRALLSDYPYVRICHGTGTGKLYRAVHDYLRDHPSVRAFRFGTPDEGGGGVTIVQF